jgi:FSR family fosmidomycin resistance protein-like MFS transporter
MKTERFQTSNVLLLSFSHFVHDIYTSFLAPLLPLIIDKLGISLGQAGFLTTMLQLPSLFNPVIGAIADRKGLARWLVILAPTLTAVPMSLVGNAGSFHALLILFFVAGTSVALFHVPAPVLIAQASGNNRGRGMSFYMAGGESARMMGPLIGVGCVTLFGLETFYPVMLFAVITSIMLYFNLGTVEIEKSAPGKSSLSSAFATLKPVLLPLSGILTARAFMHSAMAVFLPVFVEQQTGNLWLAGSALACYEAMGVAGVLVSGTLSDRMGRKRILFIALAAAPFCLFGFIVTTGLIRFAMLLATGFFILATTPVMLAIVQETGKESPAAANGLFMMVSFVVRSATIIAMGIIGDHTGLDTMYIISALAGLGALPFLFKLKV